MNTYIFFQDIQGTVWHRRCLEVMADSKEEALKMLEPLRLVGYDASKISGNIKSVHDAFSLEDWNEDVVPPLKTNYTIAIVDDKSNEEVLTNEPLRRFYQNERVFVCSYAGNHGWGIVTEYTPVYNEEDLVKVILDDGTQLLEKGVALYEMAREVCPKCGKLMCYECENDSSYEFYCPECDENFG